MIISLLLTFHCMKTTLSIPQMAQVSCQIYELLQPGFLDSKRSSTLNFYEILPDPDCVPSGSLLRSVQLSHKFTHGTSSYPTVELTHTLAPVVGRHSPTEYNIILTACPPPNLPLELHGLHLKRYLETFHTMMYSITALFLIISKDLLNSRCNDFGSQLIWLYRPATKVVTGETGNLFFLIKLNSAGVPLPYPIEPASVTNPAELHEKHFSVAFDNHLILASVLDRYDYLTNYNSGASACFHLVHQLSKFCTYEIMAILYLSKKHNVSFALTDLNNYLFDNNFLFLRGLQIVPSTDIFSWKNVQLISLLNQIQFGIVDTKSYLYCNVRKVREMLVNMPVYDWFVIWTTSFGSDVWAAVLASWFVFAVALGVVYRRDFGDQSFSKAREIFGKITCHVWNIYILVIRQDFDFKRNLLLLFVTISGLYISLVYENVITSLVTVPTPPSVFTSIAELIQHGFRILYTSKYLWWQLALLRRFGFPEKVVNSSFQFFDGSEETLIEFLAKSGLTRYTVQADTSIIEYNAAKYAQLIDNIPGLTSAKCHVTKRHDLEMFLSWKVISLNRHWMMRSIQRMHDAGLREVWRKWFIWGTIKHDKLLPKLYASHEPFVDVITIKQVLACLMFCGGSIILAGFIFIGEVLSKWKRTAKVSISKESNRKTRPNQVNKCVPVHCLLHFLRSVRNQIRADFILLLLPSGR